MARRPYYLQARQGKKGTTYYVRFYDQYGELLPARSSGQRTKAAAATWAQEQLKKGIIYKKQDQTFAQYAQDWWLWDRCEYVKSKLVRGKMISRRYVDEMHQLLHNHILPYFKNFKLDQIRRPVIEKFIFHLSEKEGTRGKLSSSSINRILGNLNIMLNRAESMEDIQRNPMRGVERPAETSRESGTFTMDEIKLIFSDDALYSVWFGDFKNFTANLLALTTGMRLGEIRALQVQNVHNNYIEVLWSWTKKYGPTVPKWQSRRCVPIPTRTSSYLQELIKQSPYKQPGDLVFFGKAPNVPINDKTLERSLYKSMERIGINEEERRVRNLKFHSWRHTFNTIMRGNVPDIKLQLLTGHRSERMTNHYTHFQLTDYQDVLQIQEQFFS